MAVSGAVCARWDCRVSREYCEFLDGPDGDAERHVLVNAITTNHTSFFREQHHFDYLAKTILPAIGRSKAQPNRRLRIWSAGCSTGEEPYTVAMTVCDSHVLLSDWDIKILATDLDTERHRACRGWSL